MKINHDTIINILLTLGETFLICEKNYCYKNFMGCVIIFYHFIKFDALVIINHTTEIINCCVILKEKIHVIMKYINSGLA